jgi:hypothetical protein
MKNLHLITICYFVLQNVAFAQLPETSELFATLRQHHDTRTEALTAEYRTADGVKWMRWVPNVGIMYNLQGQPRPAINFSIDRIYQNIKDKDLRKAKTEAVKLNANISFKDDSLNLVYILKRIDILKNGLIVLEAQQRIDDKLFEIVKAKFNANEITPTVFLTEERQYLERGATLDRRREEIGLLEIEALKVAKF